MTASGGELEARGIEQKGKGLLDKDNSVVFAGWSGIRYTKW